MKLKVNSLGQKQTNKQNVTTAEARNVISAFLAKLKGEHSQQRKQELRTTRRKDSQVKILGLEGQAREMRLDFNGQGFWTKTIWLELQPELLSKHGTGVLVPRLQHKQLSAYPLPFPPSLTPQMCS